MRRMNVNNKTTAATIVKVKRRSKFRKALFVLNQLRGSKFIAFGLVVVITCLLYAGFIEFYLRFILIGSDEYNSLKQSDNYNKTSAKPTTSTTTTTTTKNEICTKTDILISEDQEIDGELISTPLTSDNNLKSSPPVPVPVPVPLESSPKTTDSPKSLTKKIISNLKVSNKTVQPLVESIPETGNQMEINSTSVPCTETSDASDSESSLINDSETEAETLTSTVTPSADFVEASPVIVSDDSSTLSDTSVKADHFTPFAGPVTPSDNNIEESHDTFSDGPIAPSDGPIVNSNELLYDHFEESLDTLSEVSVTLSEISAASSNFSLAENLAEVGHVIPDNVKRRNFKRNLRKYFKLKTYKSKVEVEVEEEEEDIYVVSNDSVYDNFDLINSDDNKSVISEPKTQQNNYNNILIKDSEPKQDQENENETLHQPCTYVDKENESKQNVLSELKDAKDETEKQSTPQTAGINNNKDSSTKSSSKLLTRSHTTKMDASSDSDNNSDSDLPENSNSQKPTVIKRFIPAFKLDDCATYSMFRTNNEREREKELDTFATKNNIKTNFSKINK